MGASNKALLLGQVVVFFAAVVLGVGANSDDLHDFGSGNWFIRAATAGVGVVFGFAIGWKDTRPRIVVAQVLLALLIVFIVGSAMVSGTISFWTGYTALMSIALGGAVRQLWDARSPSTGSASSS